MSSKPVYDPRKFPTEFDSPYELDSTYHLLHADYNKIGEQLGVKESELALAIQKADEWKASCEAKTAEYEAEKAEKERIAALLQAKINELEAKLANPAAVVQPSVQVAAVAPSVAVLSDIDRLKRIGGLLKTVDRWSDVDIAEKQIQDDVGVIVDRLVFGDEEASSQQIKDAVCEGFSTAVDNYYQRDGGRKAYVARVFATGSTTTPARRFEYIANLFGKADRKLDVAKDKGYLDLRDNVGLIVDRLAPGFNAANKRNVGQWVFGDLSTAVMKIFQRDEDRKVAKDRAELQRPSKRSKGSAKNAKALVTNSYGDLKFKQDSQLKKAGSSNGGDDRRDYNREAEMAKCGVSSKDIDRWCAAEQRNRF